DTAGRFYVGPQGAGADPGPACYGLGGNAPTVTDAQLVLGRLKSGRYANGLIQLDEARAKRAIETKLAGPLGLSVDEAAYGVLRMADQSIRHALERMSSERGCNPQGFVLVAGGGAGALHAAPVARQLGCKSVYVPRLAGVLCAFGMCNSDIRHDYVQSAMRDLEENDMSVFDDRFTAMEAEAEKALARDGFEPGAMTFERFMDLKYAGQQWSVKVPVPDLSGDGSAVRRRFDEEYRQLYGLVPGRGSVVVDKLRLIGLGELPRIDLNVSVEADAPPTPVEERIVYIDEVVGRRSIPVYDGAEFMPGQSCRGPALIEEDTTTILVGRGDHIEMDAHGNYRIELNSEGAENVN
ncbi:MAG: hydantoinase/oxoprolinase family protein, partial [Ruegeria sp.]